MSFNCFFVFSQIVKHCWALIYFKFRSFITFVVIPVFNILFKGKNKKKNKKNTRKIVNKLRKDMKQIIIEQEEKNKQTKVKIL